MATGMEPNARGTMWRSLGPEGSRDCTRSGQGHLVHRGKVAGAAGVFPRVFPLDHLHLAILRGELGSNMQRIVTTLGTYLVHPNMVVSRGKHLRQSIHGHQVKIVNEMS